MTTQDRELSLSEHLASIHRGANWFYWIIGLSVVNLALALAESNTHFLIGLSMSELASGFVVLPDGGTVAKVIGIVMITLVLGGYFLIGRQAHKPSRLAFIIGMILYTLDGLIYIAFEDYLPAAFHAYVIYNFYMGYRSLDDYFAVFNEVAFDPEVVDVVAEEVVPAIASVENPAPEIKDPYDPI